MSLLKSSKFWSALALVASVVCVLAMLNTLSSFRSGAEGVTFRSAGEDLRTLIQIGAGVFVFALATLVFAFKNKVALALSLLATIVIGVPVVGAMVLNPDQISPPAAQAGPPQDGGMGAPGGMTGGATRTPPLNDISTDTMDPPLFNAVASIRPEGSNTLEYPANGPELQQQLFPDIAPIETDLSKEEAFDRALSVAKRMRWDIVAEDQDSGIIEGVATTLFFGFKDDVVIRIREDGTGSVVDIRSHSRLGRGDRGKNAERVRAFIDRF